MRSPQTIVKAALQLLRQCLLNGRDPADAWVPMTREELATLCYEVRETGRILGMMVYVEGGPHRVIS